MRLNQAQIAAILAAVHAEGGPSARAVVYGSRLDDSARGGDVDLLVEGDDELQPLQRARIKLRLEGELGLPVDVISKKRGTAATAFQHIVLANGVAL